MAFMDVTEMCQLTEIELATLYNNSTSQKDENSTLEQFLAGHDVACKQLTFETLISILVPVIFAIIVLVGIVGNLLVLFVVLLKQQMRNTTNVLIVNLAMSDLFFVIICVPPSALDYAISWPLGDICCRLVQYIIHVTCYGSVLTLVYLSLDRYLAVVYPVRSITWRTVCNACILIFITWLVILAACSPILFVYKTGEYEHPPGTKRKYCSFDRDHYNEPAFISIFFITSMVLPLLAILSFYFNMLIRLWKGSAATHGPGPMRDKNTTKGIENKVRVTRMIIIVIVVFVVCWLPLQLVLLLKAFGFYSTESNGAVIFQIFANCLAYFNSCLNPILYAFFSTNYRAAFWNIISCGNTPQLPNNSIANGLDRPLKKDQNFGQKHAIRHSTIKIIPNRENGEGFELQPILDDGKCLKPNNDVDLRKLSAKTENTYVNNVSFENKSVFPAEENQINVRATLH